MPRAARIDHPDLLQHVIVRGIEKKPIFLDGADLGGGDAGNLLNKLFDLIGG